MAPSAHVMANYNVGFNDAAEHDFLQQDCNRLNGTLAPCDVADFGAYILATAGGITPFANDMCCWHFP